MKLYLLEQHLIRGYDITIISVVCAENEETAKSIYPGGEEYDTEGQRDWPMKQQRNIEITVTYLAEAVNCEQGVICASFNAG